METTRALALAGADVVLGVRDPEKGERLVHELGPDASGELRAVPLDLRDLASVSAFADAVAGPVDLLLANGGVSKTPDAHLANGLDVRFATNHLGHFLLALRLHAPMRERGARIVVVSSAAHKGAPVHLDDLQWQSREHVAGMAYAESKSANILFAQEATRRWSPDGIFANAVLPGSALTGLQRFHGEELKRQIGFILPDGSLNPILKTPAQAAATTLWAATAPGARGTRWPGARGLRRGAARGPRHASVVRLRRGRRRPGHRGGGCGTSPSTCCTGSASTRERVRLSAPSTAPCASCTRRTGVARRRARARTSPGRGARSARGARRTPATTSPSRPRTRA